MATRTKKSTTTAQGDGDADKIVVGYDEAVSADSVASDSDAEAVDPEPSGMSALIYYPSKEVPAKKATKRVWSTFERKDGKLSSKNHALSAGVNIVSSSDAQAFKKLFGSVIRSGVVEVVENVSGLTRSGVKTLANLSQFESGQAERIASLESNRTTLDRWLDAERRQPVIRAINNRITQMTANQSSVL